ncbi:hypothetical protein [Pseudochryseolinea flava]|uniref:STAS domain-containing protein n=1 Tax=Pseudochryseolinea flava TaxID=2059302 RepID=A0A364Y1M3_9BACT|nr:hypothetical protein [Pseudochryseolinea flava]RAW00530.1 hypothetical protein DQQ10_13095 [Pseudochryseolinea flava]
MKSAQIIIGERGEVTLTITERVTSADFINDLYQDLLQRQAPIKFELNSVLAHDYMLVQMMGLLAKEKKTISIVWLDHKPASPIAEVIEALIQTK